jgi:hypothetical protein
MSFGVRLHATKAALWLHTRGRVTVTMADSVVRILTANGWQVAPAADAAVDARLVYQLRRASASLAIDHRPVQGELWLWLYDGEDRRCLGLRYGDALHDVLAKVVSMQDHLFLDGYLLHFRELQTVCDATIVAWEQLGPRPTAPQKRETRSMQIVLDPELIAQYNAAAQGGKGTPS